MKYFAKKYRSARECLVRLEVVYGFEAPIIVYRLTIGQWHWTSGHRFVVVPYIIRQFRRLRYYGVTLAITLIKRAGGGIWTP